AERQRKAGCRERSHVHFIFSLNALILAYLGFYIFRREKGPLARVFLVISLAFALWAVCVLLLRWPELHSPYWVSKVQILALLIFFNGLYYFSRLYPRMEPGGGLDLNLIPSGLITALIFFTDQVTKVDYIDGRLVYEDGFGWTL